MAAPPEAEAGPLSLAVLTGALAQQVLSTQIECQEEGVRGGLARGTDVHSKLNEMTERLHALEHRLAAMSERG